MARREALLAAADSTISFIEEQILASLPKELKENEEDAPIGVMDVMRVALDRMGKRLRTNSKKRPRPAESTQYKMKKKKKKNFDINSFCRRHVALRVAYMGEKFSGFAAQVDSEVNTVENEILKALETTRLIEEKNDPESINYCRCGRTDRGVSALSNVVAAHLRTNLTHGLGVIDPKPEEEQVEAKEELDYVSMLNGVLPPEIRILGWSPVLPSFSPRFNCSKRSYRYFFYADGFNLAAMQRAAKQLEGTHDFRNFCKMDVVHVSNFVRRVDSVQIERADSIVPLSEEEMKDPSKLPPDTMLQLTVRGTAFLYHQIRCIASVLFSVGEHAPKKESPDLIEEMLDLSKFPRKPEYPKAVPLPLMFMGPEFRRPGQPHRVVWECTDRAKKSLYAHVHRMWRTQRMRVIARGLTINADRMKTQSQLFEQLLTETRSLFDSADVSELPRGLQLDKWKRKNHAYRRFAKRRMNPTFEERVGNLHGRHLQRKKDIDVLNAARLAKMDSNKTDSQT